MAEKKDFPVFRVGIVTLSDKGYQGEREDKSGPRIKELLPAEQYGGDPRGQHGDHKTGDGEPGSECNPSSDADYQSAGKPEGGGRESWICT